MQLRSEKRLWEKKSCIRETLNLSTDVDSSTYTLFLWSKLFFGESPNNKQKIGGGGLFFGSTKYIGGALKKSLGEESKFYFFLFFGGPNIFLRDSPEKLRGRG